MSEPPNHQRRGAAATELAILLPFLALAFSVVLDYGRAYHVSQTIQSSAQAGVLYASGTASATPGTTATDAAQQAAVAEAASLQPAVQTDQVSVTITKTAATVTVSYDFAFLTPVMGASRNLTITRTATMNLAPQP